MPPNNGQVYGIHAATQGFFKAFVSHATTGDVQAVCSDDLAEALEKSGLLQGRRLARTRGLSDIRDCALYYELPIVNDIWARELVGGAQYSICGINHTLSGILAQHHLRDIFLAPLNRWDAIICTSRASRSVFEKIFDLWREYLSARGDTRLRPFVAELPIIPLGVDVATLPSTAARAQSTNLRDRLGIRNGEIAVLFLGRLSFSSKAHPFPLFVAMDLAARQTGKKIHLIQAGWYPSTQQQLAVHELCRDLSPGVSLHELGSVTGPTKVAALGAADIFVSLADNIQETFGITPLEAMAAGLPVIASDWDGYRDTVQNGVSGFLIPTLMASARAGIDIGLLHAFGRDYNRYLLDVAQATAIDIRATSVALASLIDDPGLRHRMGAAGQLRARTEFQWPVIFKRYQDLWHELAARRPRERRAADRRSLGFYDPFTVFSEFATRQLTRETLFELEQDWIGRLAAARRSPITTSPSDLLIPATSIDMMVTRLESGSADAGELIGCVPDPANKALRSLVWLYKIGAVRITAATTIGRLAQ